MLFVEESINLKNIAKRKGVHLLLYILLSISGYSQSSIDSSSYAYWAAREIFFRRLGPELNLYNGVFYKEFIQNETDEGHPYFESDLLVDGSINYEGIHYEDVSILYDLVNDKVIIDHKFGGFKFQLISEKVNSFSLHNHFFVHLISSKPNTPPPNGFYERLYDGRFKAYAKWSKKKFDAIGAGAVQVRYEDQNQFYIFNGIEYIQVKSKSSVLNVLKDKKQSISKFIRKYKLKFGANCVESLPRILAFYESGP